MNPLRLVFVEPKGGGKIQDGVTVTPTKSEQTVEPDPGFDGLDAVTVEAIPDAYQDVTNVDAGAEDIRVGKVGIDAQGNLLNGEMLPRKPEQEKSVVPTKQAQTVSPDPGYALSGVNVSKIPDAYQDVSFVDAGAADIRVGKTGVSATGEQLDGQMLPQKLEQVKSATPTTSPQSVTPDPGYALSRVDVGAIPSEYADVSDVTATAGTVLTGSDFVDATGTLVHGACDYDADTSDADATAGQIEAGATAYVGGVKVIGTMPIRSADVEIDSLSPVPIPAGSYDGTTNAKIDDAEAAKIVPANIKKDVEIFGQIGTYEGVDTLEQYFDDTLMSVENISVTTLIASFFEGKTALQSVDFDVVTKIGSRAFYGCTNIISADFPNATSLGGYAFSHCSKLTSISAQNATDIAESAFEYSGIETANFPNASIPTSTPYRYSNIFKDCANLRQVILSNLNQTTSDMFRGCISLVDVQIPKVTIVEASNTNDGGSFAQCTALKYIELPSCTELRGRQYSGAFFGCSNLEAIDIGTSCTIQGGKTLQGCTKLASIIMRDNSVGSLGGVDAMNGTPFASNGTGGTLYVPQALISQYEQSTNWSVILAYPNNQILPIEGSPYEVTT